MRNLKVRIPYLRATPSGFYWEPSLRLKRLGFTPEALGKDLVNAVARAKALNTQAEAAGQGGAAAGQAREGTMAWLIQQWRASPSWAALSPHTRRNYGMAFGAIEAWCGHAPPRAVTRKAIKAWQRSLIANRSQAVANIVLTRLHKLMEMARDEGLIEVNPASRLGLVKIGGNREPWSREEIEVACAAARKHGRPSIALAVLLAANLGQREADILKLSRSRYDAATGMFVTQQKTKRRIGIPATLELRAALKEASATSPVFVISETTGVPYNSFTFMGLFRQICRAAGLPDERQFRDLRHTMATMLGEAGCTDEEIRAITGHADRAVVARYVRPNTTMARNAIAKLELHRKKPKLFPSPPRAPQNALVPNPAKTTENAQNSGTSAYFKKI
jgi:integrase